MTFTEDLLIQVKTQHKIADSTARVWRLRGQIPDKYFEDKSLEKANQNDLDFILTFSKVKIINWSTFDAGSQKIADFFRRKGTLG